MLVLLCAGQAQAQYLVDLSKATRVAVPDGLYIDSVITSFNDSARIGTVLRGLGNRPVPAYLAGGISKGLEEALRNAAPSQGVRHCVMRVNALDIREVSKGISEECSCALNFELLSRSGSGWVRLFEYATTSSFNGGLDATDKQPANIAAAFTKGFAEFSRLQLSGALAAAVPVAAPQAGTLAGMDLTYPVLTVGAPARGLYRDFLAFRDQHPDTVARFTLKAVNKKDPRMNFAKLTTSSDGPAQDSLWGLSDGRYLYVNVGRNFMRMERSGNDFKGVYNLNGNERADPAVTVSGLIPGLLYGALGAALASGGTSGRGIIPVRLDMFTGNLLPDGLQDGEVIGEPTTNDYLFLYSHDHLLDTTLNMYVYGGLEATLRKGEYHVLKLVSRPDLVPVEFRVGDGPTSRIDIATETMGGTTAVYMVHVRKDGATNLDRLSDEQARLELRRLDPAKEVK